MTESELEEFYRKEGEKLQAITSDFLHPILDKVLRVLEKNNLYLCNKCNCYMLKDHVCIPPLSMDYGDTLKL